MALFRFVNTLILFGLLCMLVGGCESDNTVAPPVTPTITVNGLVRNSNGLPATGTTVIISDKPPVTTDANGAFSVANVTPPYDATLIVLAGSQRAVVYEGLTRPDPFFNTFSLGLAAPKTATITGTVPISPSQTTMVFFASGAQSWQDEADPITGAFSITAFWSDTVSFFAGRLYALRWSSGNGLPIFYDALGSKDLTIIGGGIHSSNNFVTAEFSNPAEQNITGTISPPAALPLSSKGLKLNIGDATVSIANESGPGLSLSFNYIVPVFSEFNFQVDAKAIGAGLASEFMKREISAGTSGIIIRIDTPPHLTNPNSGATGVDTSTHFQWTPGTGVYVVQIAPNQGPNPAFMILTTNAEIFVPNLTDHGFGLPPNTLYHWTVIQYAPVASMDFVVSEEFIPFRNGESGDLSSGNSEIFSFTTD